MSIKEEDKNIERQPFLPVRLGDKDLWVEARGNFKDKDASGYVPTLESDQIRVDMASFEGPLDLLLFLIKSHSMDIFDIPIVEITQKYLAALEQMQKLDLDIAGDFILMAAQLAQIKSKMLLPPEEKAKEDTEEEESDPRAELVKRLIEFQKFKDAAERLAEVSQFGVDEFGRSSFDVDLFLPQEDDKPKLAPVEIFDLIAEFSKILDALEPKISHAIMSEKFSVRARMTEMIELSQVRDTYTLSEAFDFFGVKSKNEAIVTFLALLEMVKLRLLSVVQDASSAGIKIRVNRENLVDNNSFDLSDVEE